MTSSGLHWLACQNSFSTSASIYPYPQRKCWNASDVVKVVGESQKVLGYWQCYYGWLSASWLPSCCKETIVELNNLCKLGSYQCDVLGSIEKPRVHGLRWIWHASCSTGMSGTVRVKWYWLWGNRRLPYTVIVQSLSRGKKGCVCYMSQRRLWKSVSPTWNSASVQLMVKVRRDPSSTLMWISDCLKSG